MRQRMNAKPASTIVNTTGLGWRQNTLSASLAVRGEPGGGRMGLWLTVSSAVGMAVSVARKAAMAQLLARVERANTASRLCRSANFWAITSVS
jgi:hypothetical protein